MAALQQPAAAPAALLCCECDGHHIKSTSVMHCRSASVEVQKQASSIGTESLSCRQQQPLGRINWTMQITTLWAVASGCRFCISSPTGQRTALLLSSCTAAAHSMIWHCLLLLLLLLRWTAACVVASTCCILPHDQH
jgi:hypothetical protein